MAFAGPAVTSNPLSKLNSREMEILRLLSAGKSLSEIAWLVHSPYKTVANTSSIIRQKLGVRTSAELVRLCHREWRGAEGPGELTTAGGASRWRCKRFH